MAPLITAGELAGALAGSRPPALLDIRWSLTGPPGAEAYRAGHLPRAMFIDLDKELSGTPGPAGRHPMPDAERFGQAMRRAGVSGGQPVVVYDEADATAAARGWWLLRYFGHDAVTVLDGGYRAWVAAGGEVMAGEEDPPEPGDFSTRPGGMPLLDAEGAARLGSRGILLDARVRERYLGETEPIDPVAGHIPGAVSAPTTGNLAPDGRLLPPQALRARFAELGVSPEAGAAGEVGAYCGSGVTAAHEVLALETAGINAALYVGSWSNWVASPARPVAIG